VTFSAGRVVDSFTTSEGYAFTPEPLGPAREAIFVSYRPWSSWDGGKAGKVISLIDGHLLPQDAFERRAAYMFAASHGTYLNLLDDALAYAKWRDRSPGDLRGDPLPARFRLHPEDLPDARRAVATVLAADLGSEMNRVFDALDYAHLQTGILAGQSLRDKPTEREAFLAKQRQRDTSIMEMKAKAGHVPYRTDKLELLTQVYRLFGGTMTDRYVFLETL
jgi:hypothetical protein